MGCGTKKIGTFTVSVDTPPTATAITTDEIVPACTGTSSSEEKLTITVVSSSVWVDGDLRNMDLEGGYFKLGVGGFIGPVSAVYWQPGVSEATGPSGETWQGRIIVPSLPSQSNGDPYTTFETTTSITQVGTGQSEKSECSDRGVCDKESGNCQCFGGYTGVACEKQNAI